jgi:hypothetical protein
MVGRCAEGGLTFVCKAFDRFIIYRNQLVRVQAVKAQRIHSKLTSSAHVGHSLNQLRDSPMLPKLIEIVLGSELLLTGCETLMPVSHGILPLGGSHPSQIGALLVVSVGTIQIYKAFFRSDNDGKNTK